MGIIKQLIDETSASFKHISNTPEAKKLLVEEIFKRLSELDKNLERNKY